MRRFAVASLVAAATLTFGAPARAQTTTTTTTPTTTTAPPATTVPTTAPAVTTTAAGTGTATTTPAGTTAPVTPATGSGSDDDDGIPWIPIAAAVVVLGALVILIAVWARKRGARRQAVADWYRGAADATAEAGAVARLLATGTPASGQIAQQILASLHAFEDLTRSAPDDTTAGSAERARRALQSLGLAIDADYRLRRAQPAPGPEQVARSQESVRSAAGETDRTLRGVYRSFTGAD